MTTSLLRHRLEVTLGDAPLDRSTFYYRYVGGFVATGWAAVVRVGPWRRTPESAFSGFLGKLAEEEEKKRDSKRPYATAEKVVREQTSERNDNDLLCDECYGAGEFLDGGDPESGEDFPPRACPSCGGGGTAFHAEVVAAEQKCLAAAEAAEEKCPSTAPAPLTPQDKEEETAS